MDKRIAILTSSAAVALMFTGCSKKLGAFDSDFFTTQPTPLETVGERIPATVTGQIPAKFMLKNARVTATPVLVWEAEGGVQKEQKANPSVFQGEDVRDNGQVISYANGGSAVIPFNMAYDPQMSQSNLYLDFQVDQKGKNYALPRVKVGRGVVATSTLADVKSVRPAIAPDNFQKEITEKYSADIHFLINQANIRANQTSKEDYIDLNKRLVEANAAPNQEIASVTVNSYASPEGSLQFNTGLAERREKSTTALMESQLKKDKITEFGELTSSFTPEDWEGFQKLVEKSNIQDKDLILSVLKMYPDPERREQEIRNLSSVFNELADQILPQLRYSRIMAQIKVLGKSDQELISLFDTDPSKLTADEILYVATLTDDNTRKMQIYSKATELYPNDYRALNNLGAVQYATGEYKWAKLSLDNAKRMNPSAKEPEMNLGLISLMEGDTGHANESFGYAAGLPEANEAMGVLYLYNGDYKDASNIMGTVKSNNAAVAHILNKDYAKAKSALASIPNPDATTYYLTAILGARTGNENMVMTNLRQAISLDSSLASKARKDLEFARYNLSTL